MKAYDLLVQAESGLASVTGRPEGPGRVGVSACDIACGMNAHAAVLEALIHRGITGRGKGIAVSLFDGMADWMTVPLLQFEGTGKEPPRIGLAHPSICPYGAFPTRDGSLVLISIQNEREWASFCAHPGREQPPRAGTSATTTSGRGEPPGGGRAYRAVFAKLPADALCEKLAAAQIAFGRVNGVDGLSRHPQLRRIEVETPSGVVKLPAPPAQFVGERPRFGAVPEIGAHSEKIRREFAR